VDERVDILAELIVQLGANVQPGQILDIGTDIGKEELTRAVAAAAYRRGARFVEADYFDPWVKRSRLEHAADNSLEYVPSWLGDRVRALGEAHAATITLTGPVAPRLFDDLDQARVGRDVLPHLKEWMDIMNERTVNWCVAPAPTRAWAEHVFPELEPDAAYARLWDEIAYVCRLDTDDPAAAWREQCELLEEVAARLNERRFDALHFEGEGTDLLVGLLPTSRWTGATDETVDGVRFLSNLPSEEVFTAPDPQRVDGVVRSTKPLDAYGAQVAGLRVEFERGRAVRIEADKGAEAIRAIAARDEGASRLGEVALVDGSGRVGRLGTVFAETLLDENAASHVALGDGYEISVERDDLPRLNRSEIHVDFMIGGNEVDVTGVMGDGTLVPVLRKGVWQV